MIAISCVKIYDMGQLHYNRKKTDQSLSRIFLCSLYHIFCEARIRIILKKKKDLIPEKMFDLHNLIKWERCTGTENYSCISCTNFCISCTLSHRMKFM